MFDIVTPLYNKAPFISRTIESVIAQDFADWRLFVVDDGSTDDGPDLVAQFADKRITLIRQKNAGVGPARNTGIAAGSAPWVAFLDADDVWMPDHLWELDKVRQAYPDAALIGTAIKRFSGDPPPIRPRTGRLRVSRFFREMTLGRPPLYTSSAAISRKTFDKFGVFEPLNGNEDVELWARLAAQGFVAVSTKPTVFYRLDTGGITDQSNLQNSQTGPMRREDMSSTIPTLTALAPTISDPQLKQDIMEYMDSRVGIQMIQAVRYGNLDYARHCKRLYQGKPRRQAFYASVLAELPPVVNRMVIGAFIGAKRPIQAAMRLFGRA